MAGQTFGLATIQESQPYWYERLPYTTLVSLSGGNASEAIIPQTSGWNLGQSPDTLVTLEDVATARDPGLYLRATWDGQTKTMYAASHPPALEPVPVRARARDVLSLTALGTTTMPSYVLYHVSVFRLPLVWKVLLGYPLTADEQQMANDLGLTTSPVAQNGQHPIPLSAVLERTFENRQVSTPLVYDGPPISFSQSLSVRLPTVNVPVNGLLILRKISIGVGADYGPTVTINRDTQAAHLVIDASPFSMTRPIEMWIPARQQVQVQIQVNAAPPGPVPVRVEMLQLSLSNILRVRLGILSESGLVTLFQDEARARAQAQGRPVTQQELDRAAANAREFYERIQAGVM